MGVMYQKNKFSHGSDSLILRMLSNVLDCMTECCPDVRNIRAYLLTALYNAPESIDAYYDAKVAHDNGLRT